MLWIPIIFICLDVCFFAAGQAEYSETDCLNALGPVLEAAIEKSRAVSGTCIQVFPV
jgi:hypothetical protein